MLRAFRPVLEREVFVLGGARGPVRRWPLDDFFDGLETADLTEIGAGGFSELEVPHGQIYLAPAHRCCPLLSPTAMIIEACGLSWLVEELFPDRVPVDEEDGR